jgi:hypothetical protein
MVRYDIGGKKPVKVYERTVQRKIEYFEDSADGDETGTEAESETADTEADPAADGEAEDDNETP